MSSAHGLINLIQRLLGWPNTPEILCQEQRIQNYFCDKCPFFVVRDFFRADKRLSKNLTDKWAIKTFHQRPLSFSVELTLPLSLRATNLVPKIINKPQELSLHCQIIQDMLEETKATVQPSHRRSSQLKTERVIQFLLDHRKLSTHDFNVPQRDLTRQNYKRIDDDELPSWHSRKSRKSKIKHFPRDRSCETLLPNSLRHKNTPGKSCSSHFTPILGHQTQSRSASSPVLAPSTCDKKLIDPIKIPQEIHRRGDDHQEFEVASTENNPTNSVAFDEDLSAEDNSKWKDVASQCEIADSIDSGVELCKPLVGQECSGEDSDGEVDRKVKKITEDLIEWEKRAQARAKLKRVNLDKLFRSKKLIVISSSEEGSPWSSDSDMSVSSHDPSSQRQRQDKCREK